MPAAFMAVNSKCSPKLPKVIREANKMANGNPSGTTDMMAYTKNSASTFISTPLPTKSLTCIHKNCISNMNMQMTNVKKKRPRKVLSMYLSSFFIRRRKQMLRYSGYKGSVKRLEKQMQGVGDKSSRHTTFERFVVCLQMIVALRVRIVPFVRRCHRRIWYAYAVWAYG